MTRYVTRYGTRYVTAYVIAHVTAYVIAQVTAYVIAHVTAYVIAHVIGYVMYLTHTQHSALDCLSTLPHSQSVELTALLAVLLTTA